MSKTTPALINEPKPLLKWLENSLLILVLALTAFRTTYIESPHVDQAGTSFLSSEILSLLLSSLLIGCFAVWLLASMLLNQWRWRKTFFGPAVLLFVIAGVVSGWAASDKRAAMTDSVVLIAPMLTAMLLVQWLTDQRKIRMALLLIIAVALVGWVQCVDQWTDSNDVMIQQYELDPAEQLAQLGIEPDSLQHWMYEHRLYSKDIRGFLMTSNSAATFFLMALFASLGLCVQAFRQCKHTETVAALVCYVLAFLAVLAGLVMTQSKGGLGALVIGLVLFAVLGLFGRRIWKYRVAIGVVLLIAAVAAAGAMISYGRVHGRLPGGNSMLVRWQYWQSTAEMIADDPVTGVGGGNFADAYTHYKHPAASESVQNPHCWVLSLLSQYGPLGLVAFCIGIFGVFWKSLQGCWTATETIPLQNQLKGKKEWIWLLVAVVGLLLLARPILVGPTDAAQTFQQSVAGYVWLFGAPAFFFAIAFGLLSLAGGGDSSIEKRNDHLTIAIICGLTAVLIHNLIDFAIFEPGIWSTVWLFIAILVANTQNQSARLKSSVSLGSGARLLSVFAIAAVIIVFSAVIIVPPVKARAAFNTSHRSHSFEGFEKALQEAIDADVHSPEIAYAAAQMFMQMSEQQSPLTKDTLLLEKALQFVIIAQNRNRADFKPHRLESDIYLRLAERDKDNQVQDDLQKAYDALLEAKNLYPGSDKIHYGLGMIAEEMEQWEKALAHFTRALEIEQAYQEQFKVMYPDRKPVVSRLGNTACTIARAKIESLQIKLSEQGSDND